MRAICSIVALVAAGLLAAPAQATQSDVTAARPAAREATTAQTAEDAACAACRLGDAKAAGDRRRPLWRAMAARPKLRRAAGAVVRPVGRIGGRIFQARPVRGLLAGCRRSR